MHPVPASQEATGLSGYSEPVPQVPFVATYVATFVELPINLAILSRKFATKVATKIRILTGLGQALLEAAQQLAVDPAEAAVTEHANHIAALRALADVLDDRLHIGQVGGRLAEDL